MPVAQPIRTRASGSLVAAAGLAATVAAVMFALAVPRVLASFATFSGAAELRAVQAQKGVSEDTLGTLAAALQDRLRWVSSPKFGADLGLAALMLHARKADPARLALAEDALTDSLRGAPANAYAWARLAYLRDRKDAVPDSVAAALVMSILTGPHEPRLIPSRLDLGTRYWGALSPDEQDIIRRQIRYSMDVSPWDLLAAAEDDRTRGIIRGALAADPNALAAFEAAFRKRRR